MKPITDYLSNSQRAISALSTEKLASINKLIIKAYESDKQIFVIGNGGSASTASHFACDLGKGTAVEGKRRVRVISLTDNMATITAYANDISYEDIFVEQLKNLLNFGDLLIAISASGKSKNIIKAVEYANLMECPTIGLTGFDGGKLAQVATEAIIVKSDNYGIIEDLHLMINHIVREAVYEHIKEKAKGEIK